MSTPSNENRDISKAELWKSLAIQAQKGDQRAYGALLRDILPYIKSVLVGGLANPDWVEDIAQEVLISVHKSLMSYSPDRPFKPWLQSIIQFRRTDYLRQHYKVRKTKENAKEASDIFGQGVTNTYAIGESKDVEAAMSSLSDTQRKIFEMMKIKGYSAKEIANQMGMTESAVKVSAHRSLNKIKGILGDHV
jgi:RNA polymerase sigma-70 factor, ECF subfamily